MYGSHLFFDVCFWKRFVMIFKWIMFHLFICAFICFVFCSILLDKRFRSECNQHSLRIHYPPANRWDSLFLLFSSIFFVKKLVCCISHLFFPFVWHWDLLLCLALKMFLVQSSSYLILHRVNYSPRQGDISHLFLLGTVVGCRKGWRGRRRATYTSYQWYFPGKDV